MKIFDPHVDVADIYKHNKLSPQDFYSDKPDLWVSLPQIQQAGIDVIGLTLYFDQSFLETDYYAGVKSFYDFYQQLIQIDPSKFVQITSAQDLTHKPDGNLGYFFSIEGFECLRQPEDFDEFYDLGVRSFGLTWIGENEYACGRNTKNDTGISVKGKQVIDRMKQRENLIVDIAHLSQQSVFDLEKNWPGMIVTTHGNTRSVYNTSHNLTDDEIQIIVERNGVVSLFPLAEDTGAQGTFEELYRHLDYLAAKWGIDHVAFSTDIYPLPEYPFVHNAQNITIAQGWANYLTTRLSTSEAEKVLWGNWARVIKESLG